MSKNKSKKLVSISEDILEEATALSRRRGASVSKFFEDSLTQAVRVNGVGADLKQVADFFVVVQAHKVLGGIFVPAVVLDYLIEVVCADKKEQLQSKWLESGTWTGKYLKEKFADPVEALRNFLVYSRWDLNEVEVKLNSHSIRVRCISTVISAYGTELLCKFIEGILNGMGYKTSKLDCIKGMIIIESKN
jgi:hypothetical protein